MRKVFKEVEVWGKNNVLFFFSSQKSVTGPHGGLWKLWCLTLKTCSKQSLPCPAATRRAGQTPLKSVEGLSVEAVGFGSDAESIIITLWLILCYQFSHQTL